MTQWTLSGTTLTELVEAAVRRFGDRIAVDCGSSVLTYAQLWAAAGAIGKALVRAGGRGQPVGLCAGRGALTFAGYLAALRCGSTVVPLDPEHPVQRSMAMASTAGVATVLAAEAAAPQLVRALRQGGIPVLDLSVAVTHRRLSNGDADPAGPDDPAYVLFTSGSSGTPKGVPITHRSALAYLTHSVERFEIGPESRLSQTFDLVFDPSVFDLFAAWVSGATVVAVNGNELVRPARYVRQRGVTHWFSVPSAVTLATFVDGLPPASMPGLRWSMFIGDQLTWGQARAWSRAAPGSRVENVYGPTELTVACAGYRVPADASRWPETSNGTVPIGEVYPHLESRVVDASGDVATDGELWVRGVQRFDGYMDRTDNADSFVFDDGSGTDAARGRMPSRAWYRTGDRVRREAGTWVHLERLDQQVQLGGARVELGEVEAALRSHHGIEEAVVVPTADRRRLHAFCTGSDVDPREVRQALRLRLPRYMVPARIEAIAELPLTGNGKVDRRRLADRAAGRSPQEQAR
ncbi:AMP-binding protein [Micromonospora okii]|uniref:AMP-binding protein n=1 Tax=Micromonospora okii TaxID=1182970 RepID=UPI001E3BCDCB|nr:AMP-binding protein [Micromonospora okii]